MVIKKGLVIILIMIFFLIVMPGVFALADSNNRPIIIKIFPKSNEFVTGNIFSVLYSVGELKDMTLFYGNDYLSVSRDDCESGKLKKCDFENIDISEFDGKTIDLLFRLTDMKNTVYSKKVRVKVDTTPPELVDFNYDINGNRVTFMLNIIEKNFKEITFQDSNNCEFEPKAGFLCRNLRKGKCTSTKEFCSGNHDLTIMVTDKAGNSVEISERIVV